MAINHKHLPEICEAPGVPGHEAEIRKIVRRELDYDLLADNKGNLTVLIAVR